MASFSEEESDVIIYIYDLSRGMASALSHSLLGKHIPAIWHTGIVVYGREYFFGSGGIECIPKGQTIMGEPDKTLNLGKTQIPYNLFIEYVYSLAENSFKPESYDLFQHNCNNFSQEVSLFLTGKSIPQEILDLPNEVLGTPLGNTLRMILQSSVPQTNFGLRSNNQIANQAAETSGKIKPLANYSSKPPSKPKPVNFQDQDVSNLIMEIRKSNLLENQLENLFLFHRYLSSQKSPSDITSAHIDLLYDFLGGPQAIPTIKLLQAAGLQEDFYEILSKDSDHKIIKRLKNIGENSSTEHQEEVGKLFCNLSSVSQNNAWLLNRNEWLEGSKVWDNLKVTVALFVNWLLGAQESVQNLSLNLLYNMTLNAPSKSSLEESASELATAILEYLQTKRTEINLFLALSSLLILKESSPYEVPALMELLAPDFASIAASSARINHLVQQIRQT